ncbi:alpha/beta hydrolase [Nodosilinea sp. P-1105]|uniref:alpha/beta hydrolase n=1 Tax=Nodosilinea sp. P-1105 TaxID=2546229 RepID=UPI00146B1625|nr:alpha/beta hydrolase [Nodosilinea sp. P-1105]NMF85561.1 alpha/beta hydrolase [Nodosilinea sp. P-1105]
MFPTLRRRLRVQALGLSLLGLLMAAVPGQAADRLIVSYGILERSIAVADLELFAQTGRLTPQLRAYNRHLQLSQEQLEQLQQVLSTPVDLSPVAVSQFLYTEQGKLLLKQLTRVMQTPARQAGFSALRGALILAAASGEGEFTLLDVLRHYPTEAIRINVAEGLSIAQEITEAILQTEAAIALVNEVAAQEVAAAADHPPFEDLMQLVQAERQYGVRRLRLVVPGLSQPVEIYLPTLLSGQQGMPDNGFPLVVISHGLGGTSTSYDYLARYLASGGISVAALEHPGSSSQQLNALLEGRTDAVVPDEEFFRRPQDVSRTIDALSRLQTQEPSLQGQFDLTRIGLVGQSFGGYTALALAGATYDLDSLGSRCPPGTLSFNPSLLLQCQAVRLGDPGDSLIDPRISSIFVMNPIGSALFGHQGYGQISVPVMVVAGAIDTVAPAFSEQIQPFTWLTSSDRYLLLVSQASHFSVIGDIDLEGQPVTIPPEIIGLRPDLVQSYMQVLGLGFFKLTLEQDERFRPVVHAAFAEALGTSPHPLSLTTTLSEEALNEALR